MNPHPLATLNHLQRPVLAPPVLPANELPWLLRPPPGDPENFQENPINPNILLEPFSITNIRIFTVTFRL